MIRTSLLILFFIFCTKFGQAQEVYMLSRQDSAIITKYKESASKLETQNNLKEASDYYNQVAMKYWEHNYLNEALSYYKKSLELNSRLGNRNAIAMINSNIALILADKKEYIESLNYFEQTFVVRKAKNEKIGMISALINMSVVLNNLNRYDESIQKLLMALDYSREINDAQQMRSCYGMLSETYQKSGDFEKSMYYFDYYKSFNELVTETKVKKITGDLVEERLRKQLVEEKAIRDSLELLVKKRELVVKEKELEETESTNKKLLRNMSKKELELEVIKRDAILKEIQINQAEADKRKTFIIFALVVFFVLIIGLLAFYAYWMKRKDNQKLKLLNTEISQQREEIETQNEDLERSNNLLYDLNNKLTSSIQYAKLIQVAMLNKTIKISNLVKDGFILLKPRDVVSGDFFYYGKTDKKIVIAAVDCTGHGVPGAFLSMIGNNILSRIVEYENLSEPSLILSELDKGVRNSLNQEHTDNRDGMDIALVTIDYQQNKIQFAGAGNPLIYFVNGEQLTIKGSPAAIGGYSRKTEKLFEQHEISFHKDDQVALYLFSDGFIDQFDNSDKKRYTRKHFAQFLSQIQSEPFSKQSSVIEEEFVRWKGKNAQMDDVLVIGIQL